MRALALTLATVLLLAGCSVTPDRPGTTSTEPHARGGGMSTAAPPINVETIPDAVPRNEPRSRFGNPPFYEVFGKRYHVMSDATGHRETGIASWYGPGFHAANTSSGEPYDMYAMTAAHKTLPLPAYVRVRNLENGRSVVVRVNDRGPFVDGRIIDLSYTAAAKLDMLRAGTARVEMQVLNAPQAPTMGSAVSAAPSAATAAAPLFIQAGAFGERANADRLVGVLQAAGIELTTIRSEVAGDRVLHRVRIGPIGSTEEFDRMMSRLAEVGVANARLAGE